MIESGIPNDSRTAPHCRTQETKNQREKVTFLRSHKASDVKLGKPQASLLTPGSTLSTTVNTAAEIPTQEDVNHTIK